MLSYLKQIFSLIFLAIMALLPLRLSQWVGSGLGRLAHRLVKKRKRIAALNIQTCLPELSQEEQEKLLKDNFKESGKWFMECGAMWFWSPERILSRTTLSGDKELLSTIAEGNGAIITLPHLGNWEVMGPYLAQHADFMAIYKPAKEKLLNRFIIWRRQSDEIQTVPANQSGVRKLMVHLKKGGVTGLISDHQPSINGGFYIPFFGRPALTGKLTPSLVKVSKAPTFISSVVRKPKGQGFHIHFERLEFSNINDLETTAKEINLALEKEIRRTPEQHQWVYKRFSHQPEGYKNLYK